jgi:Ser/Thr protein kinase RdoA (MazF antagonist)
MDHAEIAARLAPHVREALKAFGLDGARADLVSVSENVTFRISHPEDASLYACRLHRPGYNTHADMLSERMWTRALREAGIGAPDDLTTPAGESFVEVGPPGGERRLAGLTRWLEGPLLSQTSSDPSEADRLALFHQLGALTARLHRHARSWRPPPGFTRRSMEVEVWLSERSSWGGYWRHPRLGADEAQTLAEGAQALCARLSSLERSDTTFGLIHADLHPGNVIVRPEGLAVIDFDDAIFGWRLYDVAVALFEADAPEVERAYVNGYEAAGERLAHLELLPLFRLMRGLGLIGWLAQRPEIDPGARFDALLARTLQLARDGLARN